MPPMPCWMCAGLKPVITLLAWKPSGIYFLLMYLSPFTRKRESPHLSLAGRG